MKKRGKIILGILAALIVVAGGAFYTWAQQPSSRLLLSSIYFMEVTLKNPGYLLHDIDIMEMCRDYGNGDTELTGKVGLSGMQQVKSSIYFDVDAKRSFAQKRISSKMDMDLLWVDMGELDFYAEDQTVYMEAPLLGDDIGYAFPTGQDLFLKMPDLTSDIDKTWFKDHMQDIADLTKQISIDQTGKTIEDEDGTVSEEFVITIPQGCGQFIWDLLGIDAPDYDVVCSMYLTKHNHLRRLSVDMSDVLDGASMVVDGEDIGTAYMYHELPDDERVEMKMVRNPDYSHWIDAEMTYYANTGKQYKMTSHITWQEAEDGFSLKATDMVMTCDGDTMAKGYFKGQMRKVPEGLPDLFGDQADYIHNLEALDWKEVRDDTEGFVNDVLGKTSFSVFMDDDK